MIMTILLLKVNEVHVTHSFSPFQAAIGKKTKKIVQKSKKMVKL